MCLAPVISKPSEIKTNRASGFSLHLSACNEQQHGLNSWQECTAGRSEQLAGVHSWQECTAGRSAQLAGVHSWQECTASYRCLVGVVKLSGSFASDAPSVFIVCVHCLCSLI